MQKRRDELGDPAVNGRIKSKWLSEKQGVKFGLDYTHSGTR
jgi:hypothetical protein